MQSCMIIAFKKVFRCGYHKMIIAFTACDPKGVKLTVLTIRHSFSGITRVISSSFCVIDLKVMHARNVI